MPSAQFRLEPSAEFVDQGEYFAVVVDGRYYRVRRELALLALHIASGGDVRGIEGVDRLIDRLCAIGVLAAEGDSDRPKVDSESQPSRFRRAGLLSYRYALWRLSPASSFVETVRRLAPPWLLGLVTLAFAFPAALAVVHLGRVIESLRLLRSPVAFVAVVLFGFATIAIHEFGHAVVLASFGGSPRAAGVGTIYLLPIAYCDVTDVWRLRSRAERAAVLLGGVGAQLIVTGVTTTLFFAVSDASPWRGILGAYVLGNLVSMLFNLVPLLPLDGYWLLAIGLDRPLLRHDAAAAFDRRAARLLGLQTERKAHEFLFAAFHALCFAAVGLLTVFMLLRYRSLLAWLPFGTRLWAVGVVLLAAIAGTKLQRWWTRVSGAASLPRKSIVLSVGLLLVFGLMTVPRFSTSVSVKAETGRNTELVLALPSSVRQLVPRHTEARVVESHGLSVTVSKWFSLPGPVNGRWELDSARYPVSSGETLEIRLKAISPGRIALAALTAALLP